jgi:hypothetical protein
LVSRLISATIEADDAYKYAGFCWPSGAARQLHREVSRARLSVDRVAERATLTVCCCDDFAPALFGDCRTFFLELLDYADNSCRAPTRVASQTRPVMSVLVVSLDRSFTALRDEAGTSLITRMDAQPAQRNAQTIVHANQEIDVSMAQIRKNARPDLSYDNMRSGRLYGAGRRSAF